MRSPDDSRYVRHPTTLDRLTADRLLTGRVDSDDAPPGYAEVAALVRDLASPAGPSELAGQAKAVAAAVSVLELRPQPRGSRGPAAISRPGRRPRHFRAKVASLVVVGTLVGGTGLAAAGVLPDTVQDAASHALAKVGISVPSSPQEVDHPASTGDEISGIAKTTTETGVDKGAAISSAASGGVSKAGVNGQAEAASTGERPTAGAQIADEASGGRSSAAAGNAP